MNVQNLERCSNERIGREMGNIVDTVEDRIQNAILTVIGNIIAPRIKLAVRLINASSGQDATSIGESIGITASLEKVSERNNTLQVLKANYETRKNIPDQVGELSVSGTHFDWQSHTHHSTSSNWVKTNSVRNDLYIWIY